MRIRALSSEVERRAFNPCVDGSNPSEPTNSYKKELTMSLSDEMTQEEFIARKKELIAEMEEQGRRQMRTYTFIDEEFNNAIELHAKVKNRAPYDQALFWARLGKACEDRPNSKYAEIMNDLLFMESSEGEGV